MLNQVKKRTSGEKDPARRPQSRAAPIIERAPLPTVEVQGSTHILCYVNSAFCRLLGKTRKELIGKPFAEIVWGGEKCLPILDQVYQTGEGANYVQQDDSASEPAYWLYAMWPALDANERPVGAIIQLTRAVDFRQNATAINEALLIAGLRQHELTEVAERLNSQLLGEISQRKEAEDMLHHAKAGLVDHAANLEHLVQERTAALTASNKQMELFIYTVAHDLRAPLRTMQGFSTLLLEEAGHGLSEAARSFAGRISRSAQFMDALLRDLLAFSQLSQAEIQLLPIKLETVVGAVLSSLAGEIQEANARVELLPPWPAVLAHEATVGQALANLVRNALKFVADGVQPVVKIWAEERDGWVRLWVEDKGIGIAPEYQEQIFGLFKRLHGERFAGTGLGLAILQKGVERMGGRVGLESSTGQGSRFWLELRKA